MVRPSTEELGSQQPPVCAAWGALLTQEQQNRPDQQLKEKCRRQSLRILLQQLQQLSICRGQAVLKGYARSATLICPPAVVKNINAFTNSYV